MSCRRLDRLLLLLSAGALAALAASALYQIQFFLRIPADLLSFAESPFVSDIIRLKLGLPLYSPPEDNNSYPYSPGAQLLTYAIARAVGNTESVPVFRLIQFSYVLAAAAVAAVGVALLAKRLVPDHAARLAPFWFAVSAPLLLLVAVDPRVNLYTHSLHNDGLALLVSAAAFLLLAWHSRRSSRAAVYMMALLPASGFMVKQSLLIWLPLFTLYLLGSDPRRWRRAVLFGTASGAVATSCALACYYLWGPDYLWWVFAALGAKEVSLARSGLHLLGAGGYVIMGLVALGVLVQGSRDRPTLLVLCVWSFLMAVGAYTSGVAWVSNHLGPAALLGTALFLTAMARMWSAESTADAPYHARLRRVLISATLVLLPGALGLVRLPADPVSPDMYRYIGAIEAEFGDHPADSILLDNGSWLYLREGVLMQDRSSPVALHVGQNQPEISHEFLRCTIARIQSRTYARILVHALHSAESHYDANFRGSGVREAILASYREVRRIRGVEGVQNWWPRSLLLEISVMEPIDEPAGPIPDQCR